MVARCQSPVAPKRLRIETCGDTIPIRTVPELVSDLLLRYGTVRINTSESINVMTDDTQIVDLIERATSDQPFCACGRHTSAVWRSGIVWLECASFRETGRGRVARLLAGATAPVHVRRPIVEAPAPTANAA
jgi:hypothetical protein